jgi:hypothetical protein
MLSAFTTEEFGSMLVLVLAKREGKRYYVLGSSRYNSFAVVEAHTQLGNTFQTRRVVQ